MSTPSRFFHRLSHLAAAFVALTSVAGATGCLGHQMAEDELDEAGSLYAAKRFVGSYEGTCEVEDVGSFELGATVWEEGVGGEVVARHEGYVAMDREDCEDCNAGAQEVEGQLYIDEEQGFTALVLDPEDDAGSVVVYLPLDLTHGERSVTCEYHEYHAGSGGDALTCVASLFTSCGGSGGGTAIHSGEGDLEFWRE